VTPLDMGPTGLHWTSTFNYGHNSSRVLSLTPSVSTITLASTWGANIEARVGQPYGTIFGYAYARDPQTHQILVDPESGYPEVSSTRQVLGNLQPKWTGGWSNDFRWRNFSLSALLDFHVGGQILSISNMFGDYAGVFQESLQGREVDWNNPGVVVKGLNANTRQPNTVAVNPEVYWEDGLFELHERWVYNDTWTKLRELRFGVDLPQRWSNRFNATAMNLSFIGRNLYTWTNVPNIDPEFAYSTGNAQGYEFAALPNQRSVGVALRITP
jgi:hypothetical protein